MTAAAAVVGIDPGLTGALARIEPGRVDLRDMPVVAGEVDVSALVTILAGWGPVERVCIEDVHAMPRQGVSSTFRFGMCFGTLLGVVGALQRPLLRVSPARWTRSLGVGSDKGEHRRRAMEMFPSHAEMFGRVRDDGRADAVLIAAWARAQIAAGAVA